jgi:hypothetical protein
MHLFKYTLLFFFDIKIYSIITSNCSNLEINNETHQLCKCTLLLLAIDHKYKWQICYKNKNNLKNGFDYFKKATLQNGVSDFKTFKFNHAIEFLNYEIKDASQFGSRI